jgi:3-oxoacyl-[acyl-carrier-protein] synthase II
MSSDAKSLVATNLNGIKLCLIKSLEKAEITAANVEYINAHGTSTKLNDATEAKAIEEIFENKPFVSSTKSIHGHLLGATGALEAALCSLMIYNKLIVPQINVPTSDIDEDVKINLLNTKQVKYNGGAIISNSFAFGGHNVSLVFKGIN